eukprot:scaffold81351_cov48-Phaeocystis_antarctica.AAC.2
MRLTSTCCQEEKGAGCQEDAIVHGEEGMGRAAYRCHGQCEQKHSQKVRIGFQNRRRYSPPPPSFYRHTRHAELMQNITHIAPLYSLCQATEQGRVTGELGLRQG